MRGFDRGPTDMEKHGELSCHGNSLKSHAKRAKSKSSHGNRKYSEKVMQKTWNFSTAYYESRTRSSDNSISMGVLQ